MDLGRVRDGFREAEILDFRTFFDVFSMSFFKRASEDEKIEKKCEKNKVQHFSAARLRCTGPAGEIF